MVDLYHNAIVVADTHLTSKRPAVRKDDYVLAQLSKMQQIFELAWERSGGLILHCGDLTDKPRLDIGMLLDLISFARRYGAQIYTVFGQHDLSYRQRSNTVLALLDYIGVVTILGPKPVALDHGIDLYGWSFDEAEYPTIVDHDKTNILVMHRLVSDRPEFPGHKGFLTPNMLFGLGFDFVFAGDNHRTFFEVRGGRSVVSPGSMVRKSVDQINHQPSVFDADIRGGAIEQIKLNVEQDVFGYTSLDIGIKKGKEKMKFPEILSRHKAGSSVSVEQAIESAATKGTDPKVMAKVWELLERAKGEHDGVR